MLLLLLRIRRLSLTRGRNNANVFFGRVGSVRYGALAMLLLLLMMMVMMMAVLFVSHRRRTTVGYGDGRRQILAKRFYNQPADVPRIWSGIPVVVVRM